jgi:hypothetical protein
MSDEENTRFEGMGIEGKVEDADVENGFTDLNVAPEVPEAETKYDTQANEAPKTLSRSDMQRDKKRLKEGRKHMNRAAKK